MFLKIFNTNISINYSTIKKLSILYCVIPIAIFFIGWLNICVCIFATIFLGASIFFWKAQIGTNSDTIKIITIKHVLCIIIVVSLIVTLTGIGGYFSQVIDFSWRNAIFRDLIDYTWPVYYSNLDGAICYYITYWLPSAVIGKLLGYGMAQFFLFIWTILGICLIVALLAFNLNIDKPSMLYFVIFTFFSFGLLEFFSASILDVFLEEYNLVYTNSLNSLAHIVFINNYSAMTFLYNQSVVPWIIMLLIISETSIKNYAFYGVLAFPYGPFPFICIVAYGVVLALPFLYHKGLAKTLKNIFSIQNVFASVSILVIFGTYFIGSSKMGNSDSSVGGGGLFRWFFEDFYPEVIPFILMYYMLVVFPYFIFLFKVQKKNIIYWTTLLIFIILPHVGLTSTQNADFSSHAGVVPVFMLMYLVLQILTDKNMWEKNWRVCLVLVFFLSLTSLDFCGSIWAPLGNIAFNENIDAVSDRIWTLGDKCDEISFFVTHPHDNSIFFKYFSKLSAK